MVQRGTLIAVLVGVEIALVVMMAQSLNPGTPAVRGHDFNLGHFGATADAGQSLVPHQSFATGPSPAVVIDIGLADLTITRSETPGVDVRIMPDPNPPFSSHPNISSISDGNTINIVADHNTGWNYFEDDRRVMVGVPAGARITVIEAGDIDATGLRGDATIKSSYGKIAIQDFNAGTLRVETRNGRLTLTNVIAQQLFATSSNGRVEGTSLQVRDGTVESRNGRVTLSFAPSSDSVISAAASNGSVNVSGFAGVASTVAAHHSGGDDDDDDDDDDSGSASKTVRIGAGTGRLDVHSSNGSINLSQEG